MNFFKSLTPACFAALIFAAPAQAEMQSVPFTEDNWNLIAAASFEQVDGRAALQIGASNTDRPVTFGAAVLKGVTFLDGVIEYDLKFNETLTFSGVQFRVAGQGVSEDFYLRAHRSGNPDANQYMPRYNGVPSWQLYYGASYSSPTQYQHGVWFPVKMVIQGGLADIYIDDQTKPELTIALKRDPVSGGIMLWGLDLGGPSWISNFRFDATSQAAIVGTPVPEVTALPGTVATWQVSDAVDSAALAGAGHLDDGLMANLTFTQMTAEPTGLVNLAELQGLAEGADTALAKIEIMSDSDQLKAFDFGFSDDVTVYLNGTALFSGSDRFRSRDYRFLGTIGFNDTVWLPLTKGQNTLILAVTEDVEDKTGWAVQGRFRDMDGITTK